MLTLNLCFLAALFFGSFAIAAVVVFLPLHLMKIRGLGYWFAGFSCVWVLGVIAFSLWTARPATVFKLHFGFAPPPDVLNLNSDHYIFGDYGETTLTFEASRGTVDRIVRVRFKQTWDDPHQDHFERTFSESFGIETDHLDYDATTGHVIFKWVAID